MARAPSIAHKRMRRKAVRGRGSQPRRFMGRTTSGVLQILFLTGLTVAAIYLCWKLAAPFLEAFTWAFALAIACAPLRRLLFARMPRLPATLLIMALVIALIA